MSKPIRRDNGQFNGSIGDGGKHTPTAPPTAAQARVQDAEAALQAAQQQMLLAQAALHKALSDPVLVQKRLAEETAAVRQIVQDWKANGIPGDLHLTQPDHTDAFDLDQVRQLLYSESIDMEEQDFNQYVNDQQYEEIRDYACARLEKDGLPTDWNHVEELVHHLEVAVERGDRTAWVAERTMVDLEVPLEVDEYGYPTRWLETRVVMQDALDARYGCDKVVGGVLCQLTGLGRVEEVGPANIELSDVLVRDSAHVTVTRFMYDRAITSDEACDGAPTYTFSQVYLQR